MWKQRPGFYDWPLVQVDGSLRPGSLRAQQLGRPHPNAVPGRIEQVLFDGRHLTIRARGAGGDAELWSGVVVRAGGPSPLPAPLTHVAIDGKPVAATLRPRRFATPTVSLLGYLVSVRVPAGEHLITLA
jgi:hypothetical protein